jgi:hypothetical protein
MAFALHTERLSRRLRVTDAQGELAHLVREA